MRYLKILRAASLACLLLAASVFLPVSANAASMYGRDNYGNCTYGKCAQHTVAQTPSGLKVAVNLTDGQVVPAGGYTIIITPLNGAGESFKQADIYINGVKVASVTPGPDGSASWQWHTDRYPGNDVEIQVTDAGGGVTIFHFAVTIAANAPSLNQQASGVSGGSPAPTGEHRSYFVKLLANFTDATKHAIKNLPAPVVYSFPYFLFVLLLIEIGILLLQTQRELHEIATARRLAAQEEEIAAMKQTFLELVSHYLRTPLTILQGGAEGLSRDGVAAPTVVSLQQATTQLHDTIESLIVATTQAGMAVVSDSVAPKRKGNLAAVSGQIALWLPVALVGLVAFGFVYLANHVSAFTTNMIGILTQIIVYSILALVLYQVARRWHLHRHDAAAAQKILDERRAVQQLRDTVITQTGDTLQGQVSVLGSLLKSIPANAANAKFIHRGYDQLRNVTSKFVIATHLRGSRSTEPYAPVTLNTVYDRVSKDVTTAAAAKQIPVSIVKDTQFAMQNIGLLTLVLQTVLDNAVGYSPEQAPISMTAETTAKLTTISVIDKGSGVLPAKQAALFQPFFKAEGAEQFDREGMGFSLYLDKLIMTYLGGDIRMISDAGKGTTVNILLSQP